MNWKASLVFVALFCLSGADALAAGNAAPQTRPAADLFTHATASQMWIAQVRRIDDHYEPPFDQTSLWSRGIMGVGGADWVTLDPLEQRIVSVANVGSELALLAADGQWSISSADGDVRTGPPPPSPVNLVCLASDGDDLWALGVVKGGLAALTEPATQPDTRPTATTQAADEMALFQFTGSAWIVQSPQLPKGLSANSVDLSLAVVKGEATVASAGVDGRLHLLRLDSGHHWAEMKLNIPLTPTGGFKLLSYPPVPWLWISATADGWGDLYYDKDFSRQVSLGGAGQTGLKSRAVTVVGGRIRLMMLNADGKLLEQDFDGDPAHFAQPVGETAAVPIPSAPPVDLQPWVLVSAAMVMMACASAASYRRRLPAVQTQAQPATTADAPAASEQNQPWAQGPPTPPTRLRLAAASLRLAAGAVDATPIVLWLALFFDPDAAPVRTVAQVIDVHLWLPFLIALAGYLLHTTLAELICGASLGKMLFGLRVVGMDGKPPTRQQVLTRNLFRVCDVVIFPLVLVLFSPLRQRLGDLSAGTVVIEPDAPPPTDSDRDAEE